MKRRAAVLLLLGMTSGCTVKVASLTVASPQPIAADVLRRPTACEWRDGESCRLWLLGIPLGLPQVDEAMNAALRPVDGLYMRDVTVISAHPTYYLWGWHCYQVHGEVVRLATDDGAPRCP